MTVTSDIEKRFSPHVIYANLDFEIGDPGNKFHQLVAWLREQPVKFNYDNIRNYLRTHQPTFRSALAWLVDSEDHPSQEARVITATGVVGRTVDARYIPELNFLQIHGLRHPATSLRLVRDEVLKVQFWKVELFPAAFADPIDAIAWHLISVLREGTLNVRQCREITCRSFFEPKTRRKQYCSNACRAKDHAKSAAAMRDYMRKYRELQKMRKKRLKR